MWPSAAVPRMSRLLLTGLILMVFCASGRNQTTAARS